ncbi:rfaE bifunctional protein nucleotidyltransferase chain/domain [Pedobacter cryoconitis]|uniref:D-glycero-beta-D-manno-heptose 1-phosphate adenylyltransferase n=1 Tax=Pedobacter cryoconitis TaxID=188932 RepID=A0A7W8ZNQ5_9SPHI|nr:D-glycero-beta-D-manno-heptose 1-phosphate adenylyltransferase [Pedobacter cryoconitis]MBB5637413.1 rfaE bifunctional protein nucleotidyltransferase chain/domain [Pedobacter cryoconitis]
MNHSLSPKIVSLPELTPLVDYWKSEGKKIVFTNGCFDLLHAGHITYLTEAASLGDILIIGLNSDDSVSRIKGPSRPVNNETTRSLVLGAMSFIDAVVFFNEDTPLELIKKVLPDVLVKGGDYQIENIAGAKETIENGGTVQVLTFLPGYSSTAIIDKIKNS